MPVDQPSPPFGRVLTAMVTPFTAAGELDLDGAQQLAAHLVDAGNDGLIISGTTGESPTTSDEEKSALLRAVVEAVGDRASIVAGVGSNATAHSVRLTQDAERAGADALLVVTPYYNKPQQAGVVAHCRAVADAADLPVMLYDIPGRSGIEMTTETLCTLAEHPRVVAVKDAKLDLEATATVLSRTGLAYYCGHDPWTLPLLAIGAVGVVGTSTHFTAAGTSAMVAAYVEGRPDEARRLARQLLPAHSGVFRQPGTVMVKAVLRRLGLPAGPVRLPLVDADDAATDLLLDDLRASGAID